MAFKISDELVNKFITLYMIDVEKQLSGAGGSIVIGTDYHRGTLVEENSLDNLSGLITDRDITDTSANTVINPSTIQTNSVSRIWGTPMVQLNSSEIARFQGDGADTEALFARYVAEQYTKAMVSDMYNMGIGATVKAMLGNADIKNGDGTVGFDYGQLNLQLSKFGASSQNLETVAMRGSDYHKLVADASTSKAVDNVMGAVILGREASPFGRGLFNFDSPSLIDETKNYVLALVKNAIILNESEQRDFVLEKKGGNKNIYYAFQAQGGYDIKIKGYSYSDTAGRTGADILTTANWTKVADNVLTAGTLGEYLG